MGWTVKLDKEDFVGRRALLAEHEGTAKWKFVGLEINWEDLEELFAAKDLPPLVSGRASRLPVPIYQGSRQVGYATSSTFSPILKKYIAMGTLDSRYAEVGSEVEIEITVEFTRYKARATIVRTSFFNPERKRS